MKAQKKKVYIANFYVNRISYRALDAWDESCPDGTHHDSWEEAHAALIEHREKEVNSLLQHVKNAKESLTRAKKMIRPSSDAGETR